MTKIELQDIDLKELIERETSVHFKGNYAECPFHKEKTASLSVRFNPNKNKEFFTCFGCGEKGDAIDFIMKLRGIGFKEARKYLGIEVEKTEKELNKEKILSRIEWDVQQEYKFSFKLIGLFEFVDKNNKVVYYKAKFIKLDNKKHTSYYHFQEDGKIKNSRGTDELPYNLYNALEAVYNGGVLIVTEGEKDANRLNSILDRRSYVATSLKGCKNFDILNVRGLNMYILGDTGEAGDKYKEVTKKIFYNKAKILKIINLPGLSKLGDNKDVTDWLETGKTKEDLLGAFKRSLDIKSNYELQQWNSGICKTVFKKNGESMEPTQIRITDFTVLEATRIKFIGEEEEGIRLVLKSFTNEIFERIGESSVFDDLRTFKNFLGTIDLSFFGKGEDVTVLKSWINRYFALETQEIYPGVRFLKKGDEIIFITNDGSLTSTGINYDIRSDKRNSADVLEVDQISREELKDIYRHLFKFSTPEKAITIVGTLINNLAVAQCKALKVKLHHLLIVGESGSGKSTILENVVAPILNYGKKDIRSIGMTTSFALMKSLSDGNYPMLFDEFKPSMTDRYKLNNMSDTFRNLYDRATVSKGNKSFKTTDFTLERPVIMCGEESYPNQEKAWIERSNIVYLSRYEREQKHSDAMDWITKNEQVLNRLGKSLVETILGLDVQTYKEMRNNALGSYETLKNRVLDTAINTSCGMRIFNKLLEAHNINTFKGFDKHILDNIETEVLDSTKETNSIIEKMFILYNQMIEDGRAMEKDVVVFNGDGIFIRTSEMLNQIHEFCIRFNADIIPLKLGDFKKQAIKSGYLIQGKSKVIRTKEEGTKRFNIYNMELLRKLNVESIIPQEITRIEDDNVIPFDKTEIQGSF